MKNLRPEEENIIKNTRNLFTLENETKGIKDEILRDIKNLSEALNTKVTVIKIEYYQLKNIPMKLNHILNTSKMVSKNLVH